MTLALTSYDQLNIKINLWQSGNFDYFLPRDDFGNTLDFPKQRLAWETMRNRKIKEFAYGGAAGGAKSFTFATGFIFEHLLIAGLRSAVCRKNLNDLADATLITFLEVKNQYKLPEDSFTYHPKEHKITFGNGSCIDFLAVKFEPSDPKYNWLGSRMYSYIWLEEAQEIPFAAYTVLKTRCGRQFSLYKKLGYVINQMFITMNPYKNWVYDYFYIPFTENTLSANKMFLRALANENPTTPQEYLTTLNEIPDPIERARLRDGIWEYDDTKNSLFKYNDITRMFDDQPEQESFGMFITCDPARKGKDNAVIMVWDGYRVIEIHIAKKCFTTDIENRIMQIQEEFNIPNENVIIDSNAVGGGVNDHIENSFEYIGHSLPIVDFETNERASKDNPSPFNSLRDQVFWTASDLVNKNIPTFSKALKIEKFGSYTEHYTREIIKKEIRRELEHICKNTKDSDKKIKLTKKHEIAHIIGRSTDFSDCWSMRFIKDCTDLRNSEKHFTIGIVPESETEENLLYRKLQEAV